MNYVLLVNKQNKIKDQYLKSLELVTYKNSKQELLQIEKLCLTAYLKLKEYLLKKDIIIDISKAYSLEDSEHNTGLAIDFMLQEEDLEKYEKIYQYLKDFGFILRYPKGKEDITGYSYQSTHIRYVGVIPATIMYKNNLTLEEYLKDFSGVLVVNKEKNMTSRDVVNKVTKLLGIKKIGHTGTLDPLAEGVLVLTIGKATKLGEMLTAYEKEYIASVEMGYLTDTLDTTGKILKEKTPAKDIDLSILLSSFEKTYLQEVPIYSAVKVKGKKLYEYARENKNIKLPKKEVTIKSIVLLTTFKNTFTFKCLVSKGTYIRSLIRDMGESINEYFTMTSLKRIRQGSFFIDDAYTLEDIENNKAHILSLEEVLKNFPTIKIEDTTLLKKIKNGVAIKNTFSISDKVVFQNKDNHVVAIYQKVDDELKIYKMIKND